MSDDNRVYTQESFDSTGFYFVASDASQDYNLSLDTEYEVAPIVFADNNYHIKQINFRPDGSVKQIDFYSEDDLG